MSPPASRNILVTGGAGFIGSHLVRRLLSQGYAVVNLDLLTYAGDLRNLYELPHAQNYRFVRGDICDGALVARVLRENRIDAIVNCAAETHVDRSLVDRAPFVATNILGVQTLLDAAQDAGVGRFVQVSTDEVYGPQPATGWVDENAPLAPNNPYAASKAAADLLCRAFHQTYGFPVLVTRCVNNYGPCQNPEKFIPRMILCALRDEPLPIFGDGLHVRNWIHVEDHVTALVAILEKGTPGEIYNVSAGEESPNLHVAKRILNLLEKPVNLLQFVEDRLGHDRRYAIDPGKIRSSLEWRPAVAWEEGLSQTAQWYRHHSA